MMNTTNNSRANQGAGRTASGHKHTNDRKARRHWCANAPRTTSAVLDDSTGSSPMRTSGLAQRMVYPNVQPNQHVPKQSQKRNARRTRQRIRRAGSEESEPSEIDSRECDIEDLPAPLPSGGGTLPKNIYVPSEFYALRVRSISYAGTSKHLCERVRAAYQREYANWLAIGAFMTGPKSGRFAGAYCARRSDENIMMYAQRMSSKVVHGDLSLVPSGPVRHYYGDTVVERHRHVPCDYWTDHPPPHFSWGDNDGLGWDSEMSVWTAHPEAECMSLVQWLVRYSAQYASWHVGVDPDIRVAFAEQGLDTTLSHHVRRSDSLKVRYFMGVFKYTHAQWLTRDQAEYAREMGYTGKMSTRVYPELYRNLIRRNSSRYPDRGLANFLDAEANLLVPPDVVIDMSTYLGTVVAAHQFITHLSFERDHMCGVKRPKILLLDAQSN